MENKFIKMKKENSYKLIQLNPNVVDKVMSIENVKKNNRMIVHMANEILMNIIHFDMKVMRHNDHILYISITKNSFFFLKLNELMSNRPL
jgi:hypothetical protein